MKLEKQRHKRLLRVSWGACVLLSVLFHLIMMGGTAFIPVEWLKRPALPKPPGERQKVAVSARMVKKVPKDKPAVEQPAPPHQKQDMVKTSKEQESATRPEDPKLSSNRNTRKEGGRADPTGEKDMPEVAGEERKENEEIVLFDQDKQDGDLTHERDGSKKADPGAQNDKPPQPLDQTSPLEGNPDGLAESQNRKGDTAEKEGKEELAQNDKHAAEQAVQLPSAVTLPKSADELAAADELMALAKKIAKGEEVLDNDYRPDAHLQTDPVNKEAVYDPFFSPDSQPGFKTYERKTKVSGKFSFGRRPTLDVEATPLGEYQVLIYRAIGEQWYKQCEINKDLIVVGEVNVRILIDKAGKVRSMRQLSRIGASEVQKAFTFHAIKQAKLPVMPPVVRGMLIGDFMEMNISFKF